MAPAYWKRSLVFGLGARDALTGTYRKVQSSVCSLARHDMLLGDAVYAVMEDDMLQNLFGRRCCRISVRAYRCLQVQDAGNETECMAVWKSGAIILEEHVS